MGVFCGSRNTLAFSCHRNTRGGRHSHLKFAVPNTQLHNFPDGAPKTVNKQRKHRVFVEVDSRHRRSSEGTEKTNHPRMGTICRNGQQLFRGLVPEPQWPHPAPTLTFSKKDLLRTTWSDELGRDEVRVGVSLGVAQIASPWLVANNALLKRVRESVTLAGNVLRSNSGNSGCQRVCHFRHAACPSAEN